jgi:hypothetical protein
VAATSSKRREATYEGADGVVAHTETFLVSDHLFLAQPPLLTRRGLYLTQQVDQLIHTFYDRRYSGLIFIQIFVGHVILGNLVCPNFPSFCIGGFYASNDLRFERVAFLDQFGDAF